MNERIRQLAEQAKIDYELLPEIAREPVWIALDDELEKFAELIVAECIDKIEAHRIPVGNSAAGEMACEWTYSALKEIRDEIKQHFGVEE